MKNSVLIYKFRDLLINSGFHDEISSLIVHGSSLYRDFKSSNESSDIDFELVLHKISAETLYELKSLISTFEHKISCQVRTVKEINNFNSNLRKSNYRTFIFYSYVNGICLIGNNIYKKVVCEISDEQIFNSIINSIQISYKDIKKFFLKGESSRKVNKTIMRTLEGIILLKRILDYKKLGTEQFYIHAHNAFTSLIIKSFENSLDDQDIAIINSFAESYKNDRMNMEIFKVIDKLIELL